MEMTTGEVRALVEGNGIRPMELARGPMRFGGAMLTLDREGNVRGFRGMGALGQSGGQVIALSDAEIAAFLNRHWFIASLVSLGLIGVHGEIVEDPTLNGWVLVYRPPDSEYYRYLWMHDRPADYQDFFQAVTSGTIEGAKTALDITTILTTLAIVGLGFYAVYKLSK